MKKTLISTTAFAAGDIILTTPDKTGGPTVLEAISNRSSGKDFVNKEIPLKALSTIMWAATGKNRQPKGWTIPLAKGSQPYVSVYAITQKAVYLYDWDRHLLSLINEDKSISKKAIAQPGYENIPLILVFTTKGNSMLAENRGDIAVGAMSQNVYLATQAYGLKTRIMGSFNRVTLSSGINMDPLSKIIAVMPIGY